MGAGRGSKFKGGEMKLKIAYIHMSFVYSGGGEKLVMKEVEWLRKQKHRVDCWSPLVWKEECFPDLIKKLRVRELLPGFSWIYRKLQMNTMIYFLALLAPIVALRLKNYDIVVADHEPSAWFCFVAKRMFGIPYVLYLAQPTRLLYQRQIDLEAGLRLTKPLRFSRLLGMVLRPVIFLLDRWVVREASFVVANGWHSQQVVETIYGREVENCPAGAEGITERVLRELRSVDKVKIDSMMIEKPYILLTNRHVPQKKFEYAIEIMKRLKRRWSDLKLVITGGETEYTEELKELVKKKGLNDRVRFTGYVEESDLKQLYAGAEVYIYTAPEEDFGMGVIEAMAAGVPVVAWDSGGPSYTVLDEETGFLVEPYQVSVMGRVIEKLLRDKRLRQRMGRAGRVRARQFTWKKHGQCLEKYLIKASKMAY